MVNPMQGKSDSKWGRLVCQPWAVGSSTVGGWSVNRGRLLHQPWAVGDPEHGILRVATRLFARQCTISSIFPARCRAVNRKVEADHGAAG